MFCCNVWREHGWLRAPFTHRSAGMELQLRFEWHVLASSSANWSPADTACFWNRLFYVRRPARRVLRRR